MKGEWISRMECGEEGDMVWKTLMPMKESDGRGSEVGPKNH
jgi:hypothetical protein